MFKKEGAYKPVKGSLLNKVKGVCDKVVNKYDTFYSSPLNSAYSPNNKNYRKEIEYYNQLLLKSKNIKPYKNDIDIPFLVESIESNIRGTLIEDFITSNKVIDTVKYVGEKMIHSIGINIPKLGGSIYYSPFSKVVEQTSKIAQGFVYWASKGNDVLKLAKGTLIGATIGTVFNLIEGNSFGESVSEAGVKSGVVGAGIGIISLLAGAPVTPGITVSLLASVALDYLYDINTFGIKDFTEDVGKFIDNSGKLIK
ncbi:MAG: hypothetical protein MR601_08700 [Erysipelotrichaceae bacterium]|nr:hypothetical protein [Erysipelotrichaceae bacterium]